MGMSPDRVMLALLFVLVPCLVMKWSDEPPSAFVGILARLRHECDPMNPDADYTWAQSTRPTERNREAIIAECRSSGRKLLPEVRRALARERDDELRGMLTLIAAALGDEAALGQAYHEMVWSEHPAVRISAARTLRRLRDRRSIEWFLTALRDDHFVLNGACGIMREKFYPVRSLAQIALQEAMAGGSLSSAEVARIREGIDGKPSYEFELTRRLELEALVLEATRLEEMKRSRPGP
jgi:hypothetical protein